MSAAPQSRSVAASSSAGRFRGKAASGGPSAGGFSAESPPVEKGIVASPGSPCCLHTEPPRIANGESSLTPTVAIMIDPDDPGEAVRLVCTSQTCGQVLWSHLECLNRWERALSVAGSGHKKQQQQAAQQPPQLRCPCGRGHLVRDQRHHSQPQVIARRRQVAAAAAAAAAASGAAVSGAPPAPVNGFSYSSPTDAISRRIRQLSNSSNHSGFGFGAAAFSLSPPTCDSFAVGSATAASSSTIPFSAPYYSQHHPPPSQPPQNRHQGQGQQQAAAMVGRKNRGNIFRRRLDNYDSLRALPRCKQNKFHIVTEDDSSTENDELKSLVLTTLTACRTPQVPCVLCATQLIVYDHFPLLDGTFFLSPIRHQPDSPKCGKGYLHAVCMRCACHSQQTQHGRCLHCHTAWDGSHLLVGGVYLFDVFACSPCCRERLLCGQCRRPALAEEPGAGKEAALSKAFSHYSQRAACANCGAVDFHFVKPVWRIFAAGGSGATPQVQPSSF